MAHLPVSDRSDTTSNPKKLPRWAKAFVRSVFPPDHCIEWAASARP
jgi:hypothetical protein